MTTTTSTQFPEVAIVWIDVETTGLTAHKEQLLEIAVLVTDLDLNLLDETGYQATIAYTPQQAAAMREQAGEYVREMHDRSGLWTTIADPERSVAKDVVEASALAYIRRLVPEKRTARIGGNSVRLDLNFLDEHLPAITEHLHYRMVDVSTVTGLAHWWKGVPAFDKAGSHTAMADIRESIAELAYLREKLGLS